MGILDFTLEGRLWTFSGFPVTQSHDFDHENEGDAKRYFYELHSTNSLGITSAAYSFDSDLGEGSFVYKPEYDILQFQLVKKVMVSHYWGGTSYAIVDSSNVIEVNYFYFPPVTFIPIRCSSSEGVSITKCLATSGEIHMKVNKATGVSNAHGEIRLQPNNPTLIKGAENTVLLNGSAIQNSLIYALERGTNRVFSTTSQSDGSFEIQVSKGEYILFCVYRDDLNNLFSTVVDNYSVT